MQGSSWVDAIVSQMAFKAGCTMIMQCSQFVGCQPVCYFPPLPPLVPLPPLLCFSAKTPDKCAYSSSPNATDKLGHTRALEAACRIAQPAVALTTMPPQLWVPLLLLCCASLPATTVGAEAAGAAITAMMPNNGDR